MVVGGDDQFIDAPGAVVGNLAAKVRGALSEKCSVVREGSVQECDLNPLHCSGVVGNQVGVGVLGAVAM